MNNLPKFLSSIIFCFVILFTHAQIDFELIACKGAVSNKDEVMWQKIGNREDGFCLLNFDKAAYYIKRLKEDNTFEKTQTIPLQELKSKHSSGVYKMAGKYYLFCDDLQKNGTKYSIYEIDTKAGKLKLPAKLSFTEPDYGAFLRLSKNEKRAWLIITGTGSPKPITCITFNENMEKTGRFVAKLDLGTGNKLGETVNYTATDNELFCLIKKYKDKHTEKVNGKPNYTYDIYALSDKPKLVISINTGDKYIYDDRIKMACGSDGNLTLAGYYTTGDYCGGSAYCEGANGFFTCAVTGPKPGEINYHAFPADLAGKYLGPVERKEATGKKGGPAVQMLHLSEVKVTADGSMYILGEESGKNQGTNGGDWTTARHIYVASIKSDGTVAYSIKIPKHQVTNSYTSNLFGVYEYHGGLAFFHTDNIENKQNLNDDKLPKPLRYPRDGYYAAVTVDGKGKVEKYDTRLEVPYVATVYGSDWTKLSENEFMAPNGDGFGILKIKGK